MIFTSEDGEDGVLTVADSGCDQWTFLATCWGNLLSSDVGSELSYTGLALGFVGEENRASSPSVRDGNLLGGWGRVSHGDGVHAEGMGEQEERRTKRRGRVLIKYREHL